MHHFTEISNRRGYCRRGNFVALSSVFSLLIKEEEEVLRMSYKVASPDFRYLFESDRMLHDL